MDRNLSRAEVLLILVHDWTKHKDNDWANPVERYFIADEPSKWSGTLKEHIRVGGGGDAAVFRSLERKGLIRRPDGAPCPYSYALTEDGLLKVVKLLERR